MDQPYLIGYVQSKGSYTQYMLKDNPTNIASFIVKNATLDDDNVVQITTPLDMPFLSTCGSFIDYSADQEFLRNELLPVLIPMQLGDRKPLEVVLIPESEFDPLDDEELTFPNLEI